ncbi:MAG: hypothetical protein HWN79_15665 [Candidatus Lokiarchaeota archaeon]|nr:hypothetical protein [Candidatus Lokiarchaeota archaeon]
MSSKVVSFFDWELGFKNPRSEISSTKIISLNSIGMSDDDFKKHLKKWKNSNL